MPLKRHIRYVCRVKFKFKILNKFSKIGSMKKLLMLCAFILGSCAYDAKIDSKSTMASCIDKGLDESPMIECSSAYADERKAFCEEEYKRQFSWLRRTAQKSSDSFWMGPRVENHKDAIFIQRCLKNSGVEVFNAAY